MKYIQALVSMAVCSAVMAFANSASAQTQGSATIVRMQGEARYSTGDNIWHPLEVGNVLRSGAIIQTAAGATVDIVLAEKKETKDTLGASSSSSKSSSGASGQAPTVKQNVVRMWGDTVLAIDKLLYSQAGADAVSETQLDLRAGKIFGTVKKLSAASKYEIKTPTGIAGIRGTTYGIGADNAITVYEGSVMVSVGGGQPVLVPAGSQAVVDPATGQVTVVSVVPAGQKVEQWAAEAQAAAGAPGSTTQVFTTETTTTTDTGTTVHVSPVLGSSNSTTETDEPGDGGGVHVEPVEGDHGD